jgi:hypothetical protein
MRLVPLAMMLTLASTLVLTAQAPSTPPRDLLISGLPYLGDAGLRTELKVTEEQGARLDEHARKWMTDYLAARRDEPEKLAEFQKSHEKALAEILKPAQMQRLRQVLLQQVAPGGPRPMSISLLASVVPQLKLSEKQIEKLEGGEPMEKVLDEAQQKQWKEMLGEPFNGRLGIARQANPGGGFNKGGGFTSRTLPAAPPALVELQTKAIQDELKMTAAQLEQLGQLEQKRLEALKDYRNLARADQRKLATEVGAMVEKELAGLLTPAQARRLDQLHQQQNRELQGTAVYLTSNAETLKLTNEQQQRAGEIDRSCFLALRKAYLCGPEYDKLVALLGEIRKEHEDQLVGLLTREQRARWDDLLGPPVVKQAVPPSTSGTTLNRLGTLTATNSSLLSSDVIQKELKLTAEQVARIQERGPALRTPDTLKELLKPEQATRLQQLYLQQRQLMGGPGYLFRFSEVIEALQPTEDQKTKLQPLADQASTYYSSSFLRTELPTEEQRKEAAQQIATILTAEQQKKLQGLLGEPFAGTFPNLTGNLTRTSPTRLTTSARLTLVQDALVQKDLAVKVEQAQQIGDIITQRTMALRDLSQEELNDGKKVADLDRKAELAIEDILTPQQARRLDQIRVQQQLGTGERNLGSALAGPYGDALKLTVEQRHKLMRTHLDLERTRILIQHDTALRLSGDNQLQVLLQEFDRGVKERLLAVLTGEQSRKWAEMVGKPFEGTVRRTSTRGGSGPAGPGGWGGPGGAGGAGGRGGRTTPPRTPRNPPPDNPDPIPPE